MDSEDVERGIRLQEEINENEALRNGAKSKRQSFKDKVKAVSIDKPPAENPFGFIAAVVGIACCVIPAAICGLCCLIGLTLVANLLPIATITVGAIYIDKENCPAENIALLLVVGGSISLAETLLTTGAKIYARKKKNEANENSEVSEVKDHKYVTLLHAFLYRASFVWFIVACVCIYRLNSHVNYDSPSEVEHYCDRFLFLYAFWLVTSTFILIGVAIVLLCIVFAIDPEFVYP